MIKIFSLGLEPSINDVPANFASVREIDVFRMEYKSFINLDIIESSLRRLKFARYAEVLLCISTIVEKWFEVENV